jgi:hypothetical protein
MNSAGIAVTAAQGGAIQVSKSSADSISFRFSQDAAVQSIDGPLIWLAQDPDDAIGPLLIGDLDPRAPEVTIARAAFPGRESLRGVQFEVVSLRDARHLWALSRV